MSRIPPRHRRDDSRTPTPPPRHRRDSPRGRRDDSQSLSPPRSHRDDDQRDDVEVVTTVIVARRPPLRGIVDVATRSRRRRLVSVLHHGKRAHGTGTGTVLVITAAEEMIHGTDTGIAGVDEDVYSLRVST